MRFDEPLALCGLALCALLWWLERRRREPLRVEVPSLAVWRRAFGGGHASTPARAAARWDPRTALALAGVALLVFGATEPQCLGRGAAPRRVVLVLDETPSTFARGGGEATRGAWIRAEAARVERALGQADRLERVRVAAIDPARDALLDAVERALSNRPPPDRVIVLTDRALTEWSAPPLGGAPSGARAGVRAALAEGRLHIGAVPGEGANAGIVHAAARVRAADGALSILARIATSDADAEPVRVEVVVVREGAVVVLDRAEAAVTAQPLAAGVREVRWALPEALWRPLGAAALRVRLVPERPDGFPLDDEVELPLPGAAPRVLFDAALGRSLERALRAAGADIVVMPPPHTSADGDVGEGAAHTDDTDDAAFAHLAQLTALARSADVACVRAGSLVARAAVGLPRFEVAAAGSPGDARGALRQAPGSPLLHVQPAGVVLPIAPAAPPWGLRAAIVDAEGRPVAGLVAGAPPLVWIGAPLDDPAVDAAWAGHRSFPLLVAEGLARLCGRDGDALPARGLLSARESAEAAATGAGAALAAEALAPAGPGGPLPLGALAVALGLALLMLAWALPDPLLYSAAR